MAPNIYHYLNYRTYLRDWFDAAKQANPRLSHRGFVRRVGQKSPSLLADVIVGRRNLTGDLTSRFAAAMKLNNEQAHFFALLVLLDQEPADAERNRIWNQITANRRFREARQIEGKAFKALSEWYFPVIRELARRADFRPDPSWVAKMLTPSITVAQAKQALEVLFSLRMFKEQDGRVVQAEGAVVTPPEVAGLAVHNYHRGMLVRAHESIERFDSEQRHLMGVTVCIPESLMPALKIELNQMAERLLDLCDGAEGPERVYQLSLLAFPLTQSAPLEEE